MSEIQKDENENTVTSKTKIKKKTALKILLFIFIFATISTTAGLGFLFYKLTKQPKTIYAKITNLANENSDLFFYYNFEKQSEKVIYSKLKEEAFKTLIKNHLDKDLKEIINKINLIELGGFATFKLDKSKSALSQAMTAASSPEKLIKDNRFLTILRCEKNHCLNLYNNVTQKLSKEENSKLKKINDISLNAYEYKISNSLSFYFLYHGNVFYLSTDKEFLKSVIKKQDKVNISELIKKVRQLFTQNSKNKITTNPEFKEVLRKSNFENNQNIFYLNLKTTLGAFFKDDDPFKKYANPLKYFYFNFLNTDNKNIITTSFLKVDSKKFKDFVALQKNKYDFLNPNHLAHIHKDTTNFYAFDIPLLWKIIETIINSSDKLKATSSLMLMSVKINPEYQDISSFLQKNIQSPLYIQMQNLTEFFTMQSYKGYDNYSHFGLASLENANHMADLFSTYKHLPISLFLKSSDSKNLLNFLNLLFQNTEEEIEKKYQDQSFFYSTSKRKNYAYTIDNNYLYLIPDNKIHERQFYKNLQIKMTNDNIVKSNSYQAFQNFINNEVTNKLFLMLTYQNQKEAYQSYKNNMNQSVKDNSFFNSLMKFNVFEIWGITTLENDGVKFYQFSYHD